MQRLLEIILGLDKGFLSKEGEFHLDFNPRWPFQEQLGAAPWNIVLVILAALLVWYVYRREGRSQFARILLGTMRALLLAFVIMMLNRPVLTLTQSRNEPSYLAFVMDNSISMQVRDAGTDGGQGRSRFDAMLGLLSGEDRKLVNSLSKRHELRYYSFNRDASRLPPPASPGAAPSTRPGTNATPLFADFAPTGQSTQILASLRTVLQDLQGKRLAGIVLLTDGRDTPLEAIGDNVKALQSYGTPIYPVVVGADKPPQNLAIEGIDMQDAAFAKDIVNAKVRLRGVGYPAGHRVDVVLKNKATGQPLQKADGKFAEQTVSLTGAASQEVEINFKPGEVGTLQLVAEAVKQPGEVDEEDNTFPAQIQVLDAKISVLYVDGYPRWEYRYIKNEMIRDQTVDISCLLFSADTGFAQEGDKPITRFPESMTEMLEYDVVLFGDVDPRQFTDFQLNLVGEFVAKKNGGFGMVAGPKWAPYAFRNTAIESLLPVSLGRTPPDEGGTLTAGWRPVLTKDGESSTIFRFFEDKAVNAKFLKDEMQPVFWYSRGLTAKPGVGEVYAEHPFDTGPDARKAPVLVLGRFGGGRTLFSAIDDSWRWRFYTGESVFDTYWIQQLRYLARAKKLGQRRYTLIPMRPAYELGEQIQVKLQVLDPDLQQQLPESLVVTLIKKNTDGSEQAVRQETLQRQEGQTELYIASWPADQVGQFTARLPALSTGTEPAETPIVVKVPRLELLDPAVDRATVLSKLVTRQQDENGVDLAKLAIYDDASAAAARTELAKITSVAMDVPVYSNQLLWNAPIALVIFVLLITIEWVLRKAYGML